MDRRLAIKTCGQALGVAATLQGLPQWAQAQTPSSAKSPSNVLIVGQSAAFSGSWSDVGIQYHTGARLFFERLNAAGGIDGRKIELRKLDDGNDVERCKANTQQLLNDGAFALFGYVGTATSEAALELATQRKVPLFAPLTGALSLRTPYNKYAAHIRASYADEINSIVKQLVNLGTKKLAVFHHNDSHGRSGLEEVKKALAVHQLQPVAISGVETSAGNLTDAVHQLTEAKPEAIIQLASFKACATCVRLARKNGFNGTFYNISAVGTQALLDELGSLASGVTVSQVMPYPYTPVTPASGEYLAALNSDDGRGLRPNYTSMEGYMAARVFAELVKRAGRNASREDFVQTVQNTTALNVGGFNLSFGPQRNTGSSFVELTLLTKDGNVRR